MSRDCFPKAVVPEHLLGMPIDRLPVDTPAYLKLDQDTDSFFESVVPTLYVAPDRTLRVRRSVEVAKNSIPPNLRSPIGRAGIMRVVLYPGSALRESIVADLRFLRQPLELLDEAPDDQEEMNAWLETWTDSTPVDGFIAHDRDIKSGTYYGPPEFYPSLDRLRKVGDKALKDYKRNARTVKVGAKDDDKPAVQDKPKTEQHGIRKDQ